MTNDLWILCECGCEGLHIEKDDECGDVYLAIFQFGQHPMSIENKIRWIWRIICGRPFNDQIVVGQQNLQVVIDGLESMKE